MSAKLCGDEVRRPGSIMAKGEGFAAAGDCARRMLTGEGRVGCDLFMQWCRGAGYCWHSAVACASVCASPRGLATLRIFATLWAWAIALVLALSLIGCGGQVRDEAAAEDPFADEFATPPANDPLEGFNRKIFAFNLKADKYFLKPLAKGYKKATPGPLRAGIRNFLSNLKEPWRALNSFLQGKPRDGAFSLIRLFLNTTIGLGGLFDPATHFFEIPARREDFGQTLGRWGVPPGPYLMLPLLGPRNLRDAGGDVPGYVFDATRYAIEDSDARLALRTVDALDKRIALLGLDPLLEGQLDPYLLVREAYRQAREHEVRDQQSGALP